MIDTVVAGDVMRIEAAATQAVNDTRTGPAPLPSGVGEQDGTSTSLAACRPPAVRLAIRFAEATTSVLAGAARATLTPAVGPIGATTSEAAKAAPETPLAGHHP